MKYKYYETRQAMCSVGYYRCNEAGERDKANPAYCEGWKPINPPLYMEELREINEDPSHLAELPRVIFERRSFFGLSG